MNSFAHATGLVVETPVAKLMLTGFPCKLMFELINDVVEAPAAEFIFTRYPCNFRFLNMQLPHRFQQLYTFQTCTKACTSPTSIRNYRRQHNTVCIMANVGFRNIITIGNFPQAYPSRMVTPLFASVDCQQVSQGNQPNKILIC